MLRLTTAGLFLALLLSGQDRYERLMQDILILDAHIDTPRYFVDEGYRLADEHSYYELDIPRMRKGRMSGVFFGIYAQPQDYAPALWLPRALECLDALHREVESNRKQGHGIRVVVWRC